MENGIKLKKKMIHSGKRGGHKSVVKARGGLDDNSSTDILSRDISSTEFCPQTHGQIVNKCFIYRHVI